MHHPRPTEPCPTPNAPAGHAKLVLYDGVKRSGSLAPPTAGGRTGTTGREQAAARFDVVAIGETMALFLTEPPSPLRQAQTFVRSIAGAESNVAVGVARLGLRAAWCGRVGDDALGLAILDRLRAEGVDISRATVDRGGWTGVLVRDRHHERKISVAYARRGSAGAALGPDDVDADWVASARALHVTGITPALSPSAAAAVERAFDLARAAGVAISFDLNLRRRLWSDDEAAAALRPLAEKADVLFASEEELAVVSGRQDLEAGADWALASSVRTVVVKLGSRGAVAFTPDGVVESPGRRVTPVDPVGAGDAFVAGYLAAGLAGLSLERSLAQACRSGAAAVQVPGDIEGLPWGKDGLFDSAVGPDVDR